MPNTAAAACKLLATCVERIGPGPLGPWVGPLNFVDQTADGASAVLPNAVAAGDVLFALCTQSENVALAVQDPTNGLWPRIGFVQTGSNDRTAQLSWVPGSAAALAGLSISAPGGDGQANIVAFAFRPPVGTHVLTLGPTAILGGVGAAIDPGPMSPTQVALLVSGMRMRPNAGGRPVVAGGAFQLVGGQGAGYLQAEYQLDAAPGTYHGSFTAAIALDGWAAIAASIIASRT